MSAGLPSAPAPPEQRSARRMLWGLGLVLAGLLPFATHAWFIPSFDAETYVLTARSLARGEGYQLLGEAFQLRPPGFAVLLAPVLAWRGLDFLALNLVVGLFGVAAVLLFFHLFRARLGAWPALLLALALWANHAFQRLGNQVMSDLPGLALLLLALVLERRARRTGAVRDELWLGLAIGFGAYVRSSLTLLVPALVVARLWQRSGQRRGQQGEQREREPWSRFLLLRLALPAALGYGLIVPWNLHARANALPPPAEETLIYTYSTGMWHVDPGDPASPRLSAGELLGRFPRRARDLAGSLGSRLAPSDAGPLEWTLALAFCAALCLVAWRRREPSELYGLGMLLVLAFYFGFNRRLALPSFVLALPALAECLGRLGARLFGARARPWLIGAFALTLLVVDCHPRQGWERVEAEHERFARACAALTEVLPPEAELGAPRGLRFAVFLDRDVHSLSFVARRAKRNERPVQVALQEKLRADGIRHVLVDPEDPDASVEQALPAGASTRRIEGILVYDLLP